MLKNREILIASNNKGKIKEIEELLLPLSVKIFSTKDCSFPEPDEYGKTFAENALIKAKYYAQNTGLICLSDDSGIEVASLNGQPGVYSANWAEDALGRRDFFHAMQKIEIELNERNISTRENIDKSKLIANFTCCLCLSMPEGIDILFEGKVFGHLQFPPKGNLGFGYDPIFIADGYKKTFAEIDPAEKHAISHRAVAFQKMKKFLGL
jgi:XTP/dITP diphosphohydrolase